MSYLTENYEELREEADQRDRDISEGWNPEPTISQLASEIKDRLYVTPMWLVNFNLND